jgi:hypothetical protein
MCGSAFSRTSSQLCSVGFTSGLPAGCGSTRTVSGTANRGVRCQPARSTRSTMKYSRNSWARWAQNKALIAVFASGSTKAVNRPHWAHTVAKTETNSRTICRGTGGRSGLGAQPRRGRLIRPQRPSAWAILNTGRVSRGSRVRRAWATARGKVFYRRRAARVYYPDAAGGEPPDAPGGA